LADKLEFLKQSPFFAGIEADKLDVIGRAVFEKMLSKGEPVLDEDSESEPLYFVAEGVVKIFKISPDGKEQILLLMRPGDSFNDVSVFDDGPSPVNAQAMGAAKLYGIRRGDVEILLQQHPELSRNVIRILAGRVRQLISLVEDLSFRSVAGRVAGILLNNVGTPLEPYRLTQRDIAAMAGTAREVVGRSLKYLEGMRLIEVRGRQIVIRNKAGLRDMIEPVF